jgi:type II secretory pathway component PulF
LKLNSEITWFSKVTSLDVLNLTKHISVMLKAGITIKDALQTLANQNKSIAVTNLIQNLANDISGGSSFAGALEKYPKIFDHFFINVVKIGEESGNLEKNLEYLAEKLRKEYNLNKKIKEALFYPTLIISAAFIVGVGISLFVLPKMTDLFASLDVQLPWTTRALMAFANVMKKYNVLILIGIVAIFALIRTIINLNVIKPYWHRFIMSLPILGPFIVAAETGSFCRNLGIMLGSGVAINRALEVSTLTIENRVFRGYSKLLQKAVEDGKSMGDQLFSREYALVPPMTAKMISVGEQSGNLSDMLIYLGDYYENETDSLAKNFSVALEPILLIAIAIIVAIIALAIVTPIYQITGAVRQ